MLKNQTLSVELADFYKDNNFLLFQVRKMEEIPSNKDSTTLGSPS